MDDDPKFKALYEEIRALALKYNLQLYHTAQLGRKPHYIDVVLGVQYRQQAVEKATLTVVKARQGSNTP